MKDNIELLKECDAGVKMAIDGISHVIEETSGNNLKNLLENYEQQHKDICKTINDMLKERGASEKEPNKMGSASTWFTTNIKMAMDNSDEKIADIMMDGCNMGIKSVSKYMNMYADAKPETMAIANDIITLEQHFANELRQYL